MNKKIKEIEATGKYEAMIPQANNNEYTNFNKLADLYIKDTSCDGQLFCGCRREDCENYKTKECYKCLIKHLNEVKK